MNFNKLPLYYKFVLLSGSMLALLGLVLGLMLWNSLYEMTGQQLDQRGVALARHIASLSADHVLTDSRYALHELINETKRNNADIAYVFIQDEESRIIAQTFTLGMPQGLKHANPGTADVNIVRLNTSEGMVRDIAVPIDEGAIGHVRLGLLEDPMRGQIAVRLRNLILATLAVCLLTALLTASLAQRIVKPIVQLAKSADQISRGQLKVSITGAGDDEVGLLAKAFRRMTVSLAKTNSDRSKLLAELERKEKVRRVLLKKLLSAQEDERKRISRELHDETGQALTSLLVSMRVLSDKTADPQQKAILTSARDLAANTLRDIRNLAVELRPPAIDDLGLVPAIRKYLNEFENRHAILVRFTASNSRIHGPTALALYRVVQESLTNIVKHAEASFVEISMDIQKNHIELIILDDGKGFDLCDISASQKDKRFGLEGMRERAELLGGTLTINSSPQQGTTITVVVPNPREE